MPAKFVLTADQIEELKKAMNDGVPQYEIAEHFHTTDTVIRKFCKDNGIEQKWLHVYQCVECGAKFKAEHKTALCTKCKSTPLVCVVCGKEFPKKTFPYNQKTCSARCRGIYRKQSGIAEESAQKMKQTKLDRYGTLDPTSITKLKSGKELDAKECPLCHKIFIPNTLRQIYCTDIHYAPCPVCGKLTELKDVSMGPQACSEECRIARINATCLKKYGNKDAVNSEHAKILAKQHNLEKYGVEYPIQSVEVQNKIKASMIEKYGVEYALQNEEIKQKYRNTNLERYGASQYSATEEGKKKIAATMNERYGGFPMDKKSSLHDRYQQTMIDRYGVPYATMNPDILDKQKHNNLEKYGVEWAATTEEVNNKRKATNLARYGAENPFSSKEIQDKIKQTCIEKYGGPNPMCDPELAKIASERRDAAMLARYGTKASINVPEIRAKINKVMEEKYGVPWYVMSDKCMNENYHAISEPNKRFAACLNEFGIETEFEYYIGRPSFDIHILNTNILIEIDPTFTHNAYDNIWHDPKTSTYHLDKTKLAESNNMRCIHIFDWDDKEAIISMLLPKQSVYARNCEIRQVDRNTAEIFTNTYHLQGSCRGQDIAYGLYYKGELVQLMSFGKPRYNNKFDLELLRLCTASGLRIIGGPSKLFTAFVRNNPQKSVLSYCNASKFSGDVYERIGMSFSHTTPPAKVWSKDADYITDNFLRQRGYDQIFKTNYGKGTSNEQLMLEHGWLPVYDCGQKVFTYLPK